eukprot:Gb_04750 [translate_table: standard]
MSQMNELKVLRVISCKSLTELQGLRSLKSLIELELRDCWEFAELPPLPRGLVQARIGGLTELPGLGSLKSLTELKLTDCRELVEFPPLPRGLVQVRIVWCSWLKTISFDMSQRNDQLNVLEVHDCESLTELTRLDSLKSLTKGSLQNCQLFNRARPGSHSRVFTVEGQAGVS